MKFVRFRPAEVAISLRKSPRLTPALLAANRRNARKSTGPRTARGRQRTLLNALREGRRSRLLDTLNRAPLEQQLDFSRLYADLYKCLGPPPERAHELLPWAARAWWVKRRLKAWVRSDAFRAYVAERDGWLPEPWRMEIQCGSSLTTVTVWVRCGRGPSAPAFWRYLRSPWRDAQWDGRRPLYVGVTIRHDGARPWRPSDGPLTSATEGDRAVAELGRMPGATTPERHF